MQLKPDTCEKRLLGADGERGWEIHPERPLAGLPTGMNPAKGTLGRLVRGYKASHFLPRNHHLSRHLWRASVYSQSVHLDHISAIYFTNSLLGTNQKTFIKLKITLWEVFGRVVLEPATSAALRLVRNAGSQAVAHTCCVRICCLNKPQMISWDLSGSL